MCILVVIVVVLFSVLPSGRRRLQGLRARSRPMKNSLIHKAVRKLNSLPALTPSVSICSHKLWSTPAPQRHRTPPSLQFAPRVWVIQFLCELTIKWFCLIFKCKCDGQVYVHEQVWQEPDCDGCTTESEHLQSCGSYPVGQILSSSGAFLCRICMFALSLLFLNKTCVKGYHSQYLLWALWWPNYPNK